MPSTAFILLCGGSASRWDNHMGIPKHLAPVSGEPLAVRTMRQVRARLGITPLVVAADARIIAAVGGCVTDYDHSCCSGGALSTKPYWAARTFIIFGDTYYDKASMDTICAATGLRAFWSDTQFVGYHWDNDQDRQRVEASLRTAVFARNHAKAEHSQMAMGYLNYSFCLLQGMPIIENPVSLSGGQHDKSSPLCVELRGDCMDFDYPKEYAYFLKRIDPDDLP